MVILGLATDVSLSAVKVTCRLPYSFTTFYLSFASIICSTVTLSGLSAHAAMPQAHNATVAQRIKNDKSFLVVLRFFILISSLIHYVLIY